MTDARTQAIEYRRQLLRIVDQIERDYRLGKYAESRETSTVTLIPAPGIVGTFFVHDEKHVR